MKDFYDNMRDMKQGVAEQFEKSDRAHFTQTMVDRIRLGRSIHGPVEGAGDEYGNYKKFEEGKNQVKKVNDKGYEDRGKPVYKKNIRNMFETMANPDAEFFGKKKDEAEAKVIDESIKSTLVHDPELMEEFGQRKDRVVDNKDLHD